MIRLTAKNSNERLAYRPYGEKEGRTMKYTKYTYEREIKEDIGFRCASDHEGPDMNLKDALVYVTDEGDRRVEFPPFYGGRRVVDGIVYAVSTSPVMFYDTDGTPYKVCSYGGDHLEGLSDALKKPLDGVAGEVVELADGPAFRTADWHHLKSEALLKKQRRKLEDRLRKDPALLCRILEDLHI